MLEVRTFVVCAGLLGLVLLLPRTVAAAWPTDPTVNVPLCTATGEQSTATTVSDGAGGAIVAWLDFRHDDTLTGHYEIYAQRIAADGALLWTTDGVNPCTQPYSARMHPSTIVSDGAGGAIVAWTDNRNSGHYDIYAQRIAAAGTVPWTTNGVAVCTATGTQDYPTIVSDGAGGVIVAWTDYRSDGQGDIYAQRISASGAPQWTANGVAICTTIDVQQYPKIVSDGAGGAIVTWRSGAANGWDIYARRIKADGTVLWAATGVALSSYTPNTTSSGPTFVSDGLGGAIATWYDVRSVGTFWDYVDIRAQRIDATGAVQWTTNGVALDTLASVQYATSPTIASDGVGGAIVAWYDQRSGVGNSDIYAQRISASGAPQWTANGVAICTATGDQRLPTIVSNGADGAIVTWQDYRNGTSYDIYAQRISASGAPQWTANGVAICTATGNQQYPLIASDGAGGAIVTWVDGRSGYSAIYSDIYTQRVCSWGQLGDCPGAYVPATAPLSFALDPVRPNPSRGGALTVHFSLPTDAPARLELLDVAGRRIASHDVGMGQHTLDLGVGQHLAPGLYLVRLTQGTNVRVARVAVLR